MEGPAAGTWRTVRGVSLALLCCSVPLLGHNPYGALHRAPHLIALTLVVAAIGVRMAGRQLSYLRVATILVACHVVIHTLLAVTIERPVPGQVWTYRPEIPTPALVPSGDEDVQIHALNLAVTLTAAAVLCACESSLWTWFRISALRLLCRIPSLVRPLTPQPPGHRPVFEVPALVPCRLLKDPPRRRGPPEALAA